MPINQGSLYERALADPKAVFARPQAVLEDRRLTDGQKRKILRQWEQDARLIQVAEEEAMTAPGDGRVERERPMLQDVRSALRQLTGPAEEHPGTPTKAGASTD